MEGYIKAMEERLGVSLIGKERRAGKNGGGALLTKDARKFLKKYEQMEDGIRKCDKKFAAIFGEGVNR